MDELGRLATAFQRDASAWPRLEAAGILRVRLIARRYFGRHSDPAELIQAGLIGLWRAAQRFQEGQASFATYASMFVFGEMRRLIEREHVTPFELSRLPDEDGEDWTIPEVWRVYQPEVGPECPDSDSFAVRLLNLYQGGAGYFRISREMGVPLDLAKRFYNSMYLRERAAYGSAPRRPKLAAKEPE